MLEARIVKQRRAFTVRVDVRVEAAGSVAIFGPSGAGKSTVLSCIAGLERPDDGSVSLGGRTLYPPPAPLAERDVGYLTQQADLLPHLSVAENVCFGFDRLRPFDDMWVVELRERLRLEEVWTAPSTALSGGQARRVALARMLARKPPLVLLDEPFAALDRDIVRELLENIVRWQSRLGFALVAVDHDALLLERLCQRVVALDRGTVVQEGTWSELRERPATPALARLLEPL